MNRPVLLLLILVLLGISAGFLLFSSRSSQSEPFQAKPAAAADGDQKKGAAEPVSESPDTAGRGEEEDGSAQTAEPAGLPRAGQAAPARPEAVREPTTSEEPVPGAPSPLPLGDDFLEAMVDDSETRATFALPGGGTASGTVDLLERDEEGILLVQGRLDSPEPGFYFFQRQTEPGVLGAFFGHARFDASDIAYRAEPAGPEGEPMLVVRRLDQVICVDLPPPEADSKQNSSPAPAPGAELEGPVNAPQTHPIDIPIPSYQSIIPLQSLPGATAVVFLDFEGGPGPWAGWGDFAVQPAGSSSSQIREVWARVSEDFQPFNVNITTDRNVFESAPKNSRQRVMVTSTDTASPGNAGVANYWTFNSTSDIVCWAFYTAGKSSAEVISHEIGHTMGLSHDGRNHPDEPRQEYYSGHDAGEGGWAPIMGAAYYRTITQWSKGEYPYPTNTEDDLRILTNNNNTIDYRADDHGAVHQWASHLEIFPDGSVSNEGIIEESQSVDAFRFETKGGAISLTARPVNAGPNLDIRLELFDAGGNFIVYENPKEALAATLQRTLAAGEYTLRVKNTGYPARGSYGYTGYATLGAYLISGTVENAVLPDRFSIPENSPEGSLVGMVTKRNNHGRKVLNHVIESGNEAGAFSLHSTRGEIFVADPSILDFETLSRQWDDPATIEFFVSITNPDDPSLNELNRIVITVTDVNEPPAAADASLAIFSGTAEGAELLKVEATDGDRFDFPRFSIASGNPDGAFAIDPFSGALSLTAPIDVESETSFPLVVRVNDQGTPAAQTDVTIDVTLLPLSEPYVPGTVVRTFFEGITGTSISNLTTHSRFPDNPDSEGFLTSFDGGSHGSNYGSTMRAYLLVPKTGDYRFWIASDDGGQLLFNKLPSRNRAAERATVPGHTSLYQYDKYPEQQSDLISLTAGQICYIEARQKEGFGDDHVSVAWEGPGFSQQVIPGHYLAPYYQNYSPKIPNQTFALRKGAYEGTVAGVVAVTDVNTGESHHSFAIAGADVFAIDPDSGTISLADPDAFAAGNSFSLSVRALDTGSPAAQGAGTVTINALAKEAVDAGGIVQQIWEDFTGGTLAELEADPRFPNSPSTSRSLNSFDAGTGLGSNYGSRIRAYLIPPVTGNYRLYISSADDSDLRFSPGSNPAEAVVVAEVSGAVASGSWTEQRSQASGEFSLVGGERYYIEALHRQGAGSDHLKVGWKGGAMEEIAVIPGGNLEPFDINAPPVWQGAPYAFATYAGAAQGTAVGAVAATDPEGGALTYAILGGNEEGAFQIDPASGVISIADGSALTAGEQALLEIGVQDDGTGGVYPYKSAETTAVIDIGGIETWRAERFGADADDPLVAGDDADPDGDRLHNLIEYALALDPLSPDGGGALVVETETVDGELYLHLTVMRNSAASDVTYLIEVTGDLQPESWTESEAVIVLDSPATLRARDSVPISAAKARFIRLKITR